jgi:hypothetical protein
LELPLAAIPVAYCPEAHPAGVAARDVAVAAFPVVLLLIVAGNRLAERVPLVILAAFVVSVVADAARTGVLLTCEYRI